RTRGRGKTDPLRGPREEPVETLEAERQVRAPLRPDERMDLVDDHRLDRTERLPRGGGEIEVERLRRRDEDVRRLHAEPPALAGGRVAGTKPDRDRRRRRAGALRGGTDPGERRADVPLDVDGERLQ